MNLAHTVRVRLGLTPEEFALLLDVPSWAIEDGEELDRGAQGMVHSFLIVLSHMPAQCAQVLIEHRLKSLPPQSPDYPAFTAIARKIHNCHVL